MIPCACYSLAWQYSVCILIRMNSSSYCLIPIVYNESVQCSSAILYFALCLEDVYHMFIKVDLELSWSLSGMT